MHKEIMEYSADALFGEEDYTAFWKFPKEGTGPILVDLDILKVGEQLRIKRCHDWLNRKELADILGISVNTLADIEHGKRDIPNKCKDSVAHYLYGQYYCYGVLAVDSKEDCKSGGD
ncbi:helix-turn-helix transcriptional regulator [Paenibacillus sp. 7124]|uniref:Helix-turn-helix transcriptional regulator n=1 Tax=Paenibacillus apii TaxID=1850370 RepID=A0A6M1PM02_9BACL|nr:helix-turn-helix transcriptional regulator [Paenibacillus apii]NGM83382.1 helix-turn-helix transcriptional regulator [Paenibacillus apii]